MFWKIFSGVWLCSCKYHIKHIFYFLFTFPHIFSATKRIYNIIPQYRNTKETKPRKNIHQIRSYRETQKKKNPEKIFIKSDHTKKHKRNKTQKKKFIKSGQIKRRRKRDRRWCGSAIGARVDWRYVISVGVDLCLIGTGVGRHWCGAVRQTGGVWVGAELGSLSLSFGVWIRAWRALAASSACERAQTENFWSKNENWNGFPPHITYFTINPENIFSLTQFSKSTKQPILRKSISKFSLQSKQTQPKW